MSDVGWDMIVNNHVFVEQVLPGAIVRTMTDAEMDHYRAPFIDPPTRKPVWRWPNEIPIAGEPANVVAAVEAYNAKLQESDLPKLLFSCTPGALITAAGVAWCKENLKNLKVVDIGPGIHFVQEDNPHLIGKELSSWYAGL
jgi:haloalkane dehalogenase